MKTIRRKEKEIKDKNEIISILEQAKYITIAMSRDDEPYLVTLSHGYDKNRNCIYFHCAREGKKVDILNKNNRVWGQALIDKGYVQGVCDHLYATAHFMGRVSFLENFEEKKQALEVMIEALDDNRASIIEKQLTKKSITNINIGKIDIEYMSGKKSDKVIISI